MARIMIVDDAVFMRNMIEKILVQQGHEICAQAATAKEAVELYPRCNPDVVTMDIVMPMMEDLDGIGAIKEIRKVAPAARIIIVSAMAQHTLVMDAVQAGAKDFVTKPVQPKRLIEAVNNVLAEQKKEVPLK
jgi:two-component system, chemotaxis family, chemotaxis protein CheY